MWYNFGSFRHILLSFKDVRSFAHSFFHGSLDKMSALLLFYALVG